MPSARLRWIALLLTIALALLSVAPIRSNDYFWHLASGRWMWEHHALPERDPFGVASTPIRWIDGEWLFQAALWPLQEAGGHTAVSLACALVLGALFGGVFLASAPVAGTGAALLAVVAGWCGAVAWLTERPSTIAAALLAMLIVLLRRLDGWRRVLAVAALVALWVDVHPSALLAPVVVAIFELADRLEARRTGDAEAGLDRRVRVPPLVATTCASLALLVNPYGLAAVRAPLRLASEVRGFRNVEWGPSLPTAFPYLYVLVLAGALLALRAWRRIDTPRLAEIVVLALLTTMAIAYRRNQGLFFAAWPLLVAPGLPRLRPALAALGSALACAAVTAFTWPPLQVGIDEHFPVAAVERLRASGLQGTIYTPYGLGGFLIWSFYPQRRVLTDGRNELYVAYQAEYEAAVRDKARWQALLRRYDVRLAVFDYHLPPVRIVDPRSGRSHLVPAFALYFPVRAWAPIAVDRVAMVFARRDAFPAATLAPLDLSTRPRSPR